jgi:hypothetical protein
MDPNFANRYIVGGQFNEKRISTLAFFTVEIWPPGWRMGKGRMHEPARPTLIGGVH